MHNHAGRKVFSKKNIKLMVIGLVLVFGILYVHQKVQDACMTTEEWAIMMLTEHRYDVDAAVTDLQGLQSRGVSEAYIYKYQDEPMEAMFTTSTSRDKKDLTENKLYQRLMKKCCDITMYPSGVISFSRRGFLTGYTGFYYSPTGTEQIIDGGADWYETGWLEGNYYYYKFGY